MAKITDVGLIEINNVKSEYEYIRGLPHDVNGDNIVPTRLTPVVILPFDLSQSGHSCYKNLELPITLFFVDSMKSDFSNIGFFMNGVQIPHTIKSYKEGETAECILKFPDVD